jgi:stearoyl-CoA desaturase (delta-9 desaturase)
METAMKTRSLSAAPSGSVSSHLQRTQIRHFIVLDVLPAIGTVAALALACYVPVTRVDIALFAVFWLATGIGITVGFHRFFSHGSFETNPRVACALLIVGSMAGRGPMTWWAALHRHHHEFSDHEGDTHSPLLHGSGLIGRLRGFIHAHYTWMIAPPQPDYRRYIPDLLGNLPILRANQRYYTWVILGLVLPALIGGLVSRSALGALTGFLWGGVVRIFVVGQAISLINSVTHLLGSRPFRTRNDNSRNSMLVSLLAWGEGWHNNHHAFPYSAAFGLRWFQFDPGYMLIRALEKLGLVWSVKLPAARMVMRKRADALPAGLEH